jgi:hypothetical protein
VVNKMLQTCEVSTASPIKWQKYLPLGLDQKQLEAATIPELAAGSAAHTTMATTMKMSADERS